MTIGIIGAMDEEIQDYLDNAEDIQEHNHGGLRFYTATLAGKDTVIVRSGVGKALAATTTTLLIHKFSASEIIFTGVAGSLNPNLDIGDVVIGRDSIQHDFDARPLGFARGQISYTDLQVFPSDKTLAERALQAPLERTAISGRILTGDQFLTHKEKQDRQYLFDELQGDCVEMEGAAVALVCQLHDIPHLIVRTMSDRADGTAVSDYNEFKHIVATNSHEVVMHLLRRKE